MTQQSNKNENRPYLRFPEFQGEWEAKHIKKIGEFIGGGTPDTTNQKFWNGKTPWISSSDITIDDIHNITKTRFITEDAVRSSATRLIPKGGILMVSRVGIGKFAVADEELCTSQDFTNLITGENEYFLCYYFYARSNDFIRLSQGTSIKGFTTQDIKSAKFFIPSKSEQQKISSFLLLIDERISTQSKIIEDYKLLKKGLMQKLFKQEIRFKDENGNEFPIWKTQKLGELLEIQGGYAFKSSSFNSGKTKVIRIGDIEPRIELQNFSGVYSHEIPNKKYIVKKNDFVMALSGATFGKVGKISDNGVAYINQRVALFKTNHCLEFFHQLVLGEDFKKYIASIPTASAQPNISNNDVANYRKTIPSLEEQQKIAKTLSAIDDKITLETAILEQYQEQKKYLLQNLFI